MSKKRLQMPKFKSESEEADWWASPTGRAYVKQRSAEARPKGTKATGSGLVTKLSNKRSTQIAIRLPGTDLARARKIADRKGIGYQTLLKMLVREGLQHEARRGLEISTSATPKASGSERWIRFSNERNRRYRLESFPVSRLCVTCRNDGIMAATWRSSLTTDLSRWQMRGRFS